MGTVAKGYALIGVAVEFKKIVHECVSQVFGDHLSVIQPLCNKLLEGLLVPKGLDLGDYLDQLVIKPNRAQHFLYSVMPYENERV